VSEGEHYSGGGEKTVAKTVILDKYLKAYLDIMKANWDGPKWYIDTHSGTGFTQELGVKIPGSALRALKHDFDKFYFYEKDVGHFETLVETIDQETERSMSHGEIPDEEIPMAYSEDGSVKVMNMDCNSGVTYLAEHAGYNSHWFTFVDPERLTVERELIERLCRRGKMDILFNFQTSAFERNGSDAADHAHAKVASNLGEGFPVNGSAEDYVSYYQDDVFGKMGWKSVSRRMESERSNEWRYDLIFASKKAVALKIIDDIYTSDLKNDVAREVREWRAKTDTGQTGFGSFVSIPAVDGEDNGQASLFDFEG